MEMQNNANLFKISVLATLSIIQFPVPTKAKKLKKSDFEFNIMENCIQMGVTPYFKNSEDFLDMIGFNDDEDDI